MRMYNDRHVFVPPVTDLFDNTGKLRRVLAISLRFSRGGFILDHHANESDRLTDRHGHSIYGASIESHG